jgi:hypothetical protein
MLLASVELLVDRRLMFASSFTWSMLSAFRDDYRQSGTM